MLKSFKSKHKKNKSCPRKILATGKSFDNAIAIVIVNNNSRYNFNIKNDGAYKFEVYGERIRNRAWRGCDRGCHEKYDYIPSLYQCNILYYYTSNAYTNNAHYQFCKNCHDEIIQKKRSFFYNYLMLDDINLEVELSKDVRSYIRQLFIQSYFDNLIFFNSNNN